MVSRYMIVNADKFLYESSIQSRQPVYPTGIFYFISIDAAASRGFTNPSGWNRNRLRSKTFVIFKIILSTSLWLFPGTDLFKERDKHV